MLDYKISNELRTDKVCDTRDINIRENIHLKNYNYSANINIQELIYPQFLKYQHISNISNDAFFLATASQ